MVISRKSGHEPRRKENIEDASEFIVPVYDIVNDLYLSQSPTICLKDQDFELGDFSYSPLMSEDENEDEDINIGVYQLEFLESDIDAILRTSEELQLNWRELRPATARLTPLLVDRNAQGRRPFPWWTDFWIEVCRRVHGDADWPSQAAARRDMIDWAAMSGHGEIKDETLVKPFRALFRALGWAEH